MMIRNMKKSSKVVVLFTVLIISLILAFSILYRITESLKLEYKFWDYIYFSGVTYFTIGFGDICPVNTAGKIIVLIEAVIAMVCNGLFIGIFVTVYLSVEQTLILPSFFGLKFKNNRYAVCIPIGNKGSELINLTAVLEVFRFEDNRRIKVGEFKKDWPYIEKIAYYDVEIQKFSPNIKKLLKKILLEKSENYQIKISVQATDINTNEVVYTTKTFTSNEYKFIHEYNKIYEWKDKTRTKVDWSQFGSAEALSEEMIEQFRNYVQTIYK